MVGKHSFSPAPLIWTVQSGARSEWAPEEIDATTMPVPNDWLADPRPPGGSWRLSLTTRRWPRSARSPSTSSRSTAAARPGRRRSRRRRAAATGGLGGPCTVPAARRTAVQASASSGPRAAQATTTTAAGQARSPTRSSMKVSASTSRGSYRIRWPATLGAAASSPGQAEE